MDIANGSPRRRGGPTGCRALRGVRRPVGGGLVLACLAQIAAAQTGPYGGFRGPATVEVGGQGFAAPQTHFAAPQATFPAGQRLPGAPLVVGGPFVPGGPTAPAAGTVQFAGPGFGQGPSQPEGAVVPAQAVDPAHRPLPAAIAKLPGVEESLEVIHHRSQLMVTRSNVVRMAIADPGVIDVVQYSPSEIAIIGLTLGSTTLTLWFENVPDPLIYLVTVVRDPSIEDQRRIDYGKLERKLAVLFPNSKVYLIPLSQKIVVKGQARDTEEAARILQIVRGEVINQVGSLAGPQPIVQAVAVGGVGGVGGPGGAGYGGVGGFGDLASWYIVDMLEVPGERQIMLRVRVAELKREQLRRMGVDLSILFNGGQNLVAYSLGGLPATLTGIFNSGDINVFVNWLAANGTAKILSEPVLTVLSGHPASFLAGGEFAVPTIVGVQGAQGTSTTFRGFGTSVVAIPTIVDRDLVRMRIVPEFSQLNTGNAVNGIPGLDSRRVQTTVELREGQTVVVAGLISRTTGTEVTRIPLLGEIPWIGPKLFSAKRATEDETELLILVTPEIVRPMDPDEVPPVPGHEVTHPNDHELYHYAMTEGVPDTQVYQLAPYGRQNGVGVPVGYRVFEPAPAHPLHSPVPTNPAPATPPDPYVSGGRYVTGPPSASYGPTPMPQTWSPDATQSWQPGATYPAPSTSVPPGYQPMPAAPYSPNPQTSPQPGPYGLPQAPTSPYPNNSYSPAPAGPGPNLPAPGMSVPLPGPSTRYAPSGLRSVQTGRGAVPAAAAEVGSSGTIQQAGHTAPPSSNAPPEKSNFLSRFRRN